MSIISCFNGTLQLWGRAKASSRHLLEHRYYLTITDTTQGVNFTQVIHGHFVHILRSGQLLISFESVGHLVNQIAAKSCEMLPITRISYSTFLGPWQAVHDWMAASYWFIHLHVFQLTSAVSKPLHLICERRTGNHLSLIQSRFQATNTMMRISHCSEIV